VWMMLIMGVVGYALRKFGFDPAPLVLGLVIAPLFEQSLRQSLIMSNGNYLIFGQRPIAAGLLAVSGLLLLMSAVSYVLHRRDWRDKLAEAEAAGGGVNGGASFPPPGSGPPSRMSWSLTGCPTSDIEAS